MDGCPCDDVRMAATRCAFCKAPLPLRANTCPNCGQMAVAGGPATRTWPKVLAWLVVAGVVFALIESGHFAVTDRPAAGTLSPAR